MRGQQFVVEMRMAWTSAFKQMVLFNTSKAYVSQVGMGLRHEDLWLVYSLNLVNDIFEMDTDEGKHNYRIVHYKQTDKVIEGLCFTFIELPKFTPRTANKKRKTVLRLRFLTEIDDTKEAPSELMEESDIKKVLGELKASAFSEGELRSYDRFWASVSRERTLPEGNFERGVEKGKMDVARNIITSA